MLFLDRPLGPFHGLTVYRDHADPSAFYFVNERPRLARNDGVPEFTFLKYRRDITDNPAFDADTKAALGGGFLAFTVDLSVDEDVLDDVRKKLAAFADGEVQLGPAQFTKGAVRLSITADVAAQADAPPGQTPGTSFFEKVYGTTMPSMVGDNRAVFGVVLDQEGATLLEAALHSGISPIGVIYQLDLLGLRPAFDVKVHADYHRVYDELDLQFGLRGHYGPIGAAAEVDLAFQKLREKGAVKVEVVNFTDDADMRRQADDAFAFFKTEMLHDFFQSSMPPPALQSKSGDPGLMGQLQGVLGALTQTQSGSQTPARTTPTTLAPTPAPAAGNLSSNVTPTSSANAAATAPAAGGAAGGGTGADAAPFGVQLGFTLRHVESDELKERDYEYSMQAAVTRTVAPQGMFSTIAAGLDLSRAIQEVSLDDDFFTRMVTTATFAGDLERDGFSSVAVNIEYPGTRPAGDDASYTDGVTWTVGHTDPKTFATFLDEKKQLAYRTKVDVQFAPDSTWDGDELHFSSEWQLHTERSLLVDPFSAVDRFDLEVVPAKMDPDVQQVQVELRYVDPATGFKAQRTLVFAPGGPSQHWRLRFGETQVKTYSSRVTYVLPDNVSHVTDWVQSEGITTESGVLVVDDPFTGPPIRCRAVPLLDAADLVEADLDVTYREADTGYERHQSLVFLGQAGGGAGPLTSQVVSIPVISADTGQATYSLTVVRADGSTFQSGSQELTHDTGVVLVADGQGATHRITVHLTDADLAGKGLAAARVRLRSAGDAGEVLFLPGQTGDRLVTLVQPDDAPFTYHWEVEGYSTAGLPVPGSSGDGTDRALVVGLPVATA